MLKSKITSKNQPTFLITYKGKQSKKKNIYIHMCVCVCVCVTEALCSIPETKTTLYIKYTSLKINK